MDKDQAYEESFEKQFKKDTRPPLEVEQDNVDQYFDRAKELVKHEYWKKGYNWITERDIYIVWFSKTLLNWKALVSGNVNDGLYFEVTHNGAAQETYVDTYSKVNNISVPD